MYDVKLSEHLQIKVSHDMYQKIVDLAKRLCVRRVDIIRQALAIGLIRIELEGEKDNCTKLVNK